MGQSTQLFGPHDSLLGQDDEILGHPCTHSDAQYRLARAGLLRRRRVPHGRGGDRRQRHRDLPTGRAAKGVQEGGKSPEVSAPLCLNFQRQEERSDWICAGQRRGPGGDPICERGQPQGQLHLQMPPEHGSCEWVSSNEYHNIHPVVSFSKFPIRISLL